PEFAVQMAMGAIIGLGVGYLLPEVLKRSNFYHGGLAFVISIAARWDIGSAYFASRFAWVNQSIHHRCKADFGVPRLRGHLRTRSTPRTVSIITRPR
ncbi:hypothetical protein LCGC14_2706440, partial [marine sediment metagenome]